MYTEAMDKIHTPTLPTEIIVNLEMKRDLAKKRRIEVVARYGGRNLSRMLNISHAAVSKWSVIPPYRAYQISQIGDFKIEYLRPDLTIQPSI
jgi:hypothetical protein